jgi:ABC-type Fe3+/spermidine/putrescine transport system ATPase subunit
MIATQLLKTWSGGDELRTRSNGKDAYANGADVVHMTGEQKTDRESDYLMLDNVSKRYGEKVVVKGVSLAAARGEVLTILGPSGCGKTTTLKIIAGFLDLDGGSVKMSGRKVDHLSSHERGAAMVFQNYALFPHMTVRRNVAFGLRMRGLDKADIDRQVDEMIGLVRLSEFADRYPKELSGGQQQRVALARALIIKPNVLLLDEPFSSLDAKLRKQLRAEFLEVHRNFGITSIFVTHDLEEAFAISDKVAVMNNGNLEQVGSPAGIFSRPRSRFVADFVGHKNILSGTIATGADNRAVFTSANGFQTTLPGAAAGRALLSVPVHRIQVSRSPITAENHRTATVEGVGFLGPAIQLSLRVGNTLIETYGASTSETETLAVGDKVHVGWNGADVIVIPEGA